MNIYELKHLYYQTDNGIFQSEKHLGYFSSVNNVYDAIAFYNSQPGFVDNQNNYSIRVRTVEGLVDADVFFETIIYIYSKDYEIESTIEVGLYTDVNEAQSSLNYHNAINTILNTNKELIIEHIINRVKINQLDWAEGFTVS